MKNVLYVDNNVVFECFNRKIKVSAAVIRIWQKYIQEGLFSKEAGGVLIGREGRESNNLIIDFCTKPDASSIAAIHAISRMPIKTNINFI